MTIEQAIAHGRDQLEIFGGEHGEFIEIAIDTMYKYQQIQKIVQFGNAHELGFEYVGEKISEVLADEKT